MISAQLEKVTSHLNIKVVVIEDPFSCKLKPEYGVDSSYHLDGNDLKKINLELDEEILPYPLFPYSDHEGYKEYKRLTKEQYISLMKYRLYQVAKLGKLSELLAIVCGVQTKNIIIKWDEDKPGIKKPGFIKS